MAPQATSPSASSSTAVHRDVVLLHWMVALLFVLALTGILGRGALPAGDPLRPVLRSLHILVGQVIFVFAALRAYTRWRHPLPELPAPTPAARLSRWGAHGVHGLLYVVMFAQPLTGVLFLQAGDKTVAFLGMTWPMLVPSDPTLHFQLKEAHQWVGNAFYGLIALHIAGALWHHLVLKDGTLRRMLAFRRPPAPALAAPEVPAGTDDMPVAFRRRVVDMVHAGHSPAQVAAAFGCTAQQVSHWVAQAAGEQHVGAAVAAAPSIAAVSAPAQAERKSTAPSEPST